jgi:hypothetical protein
LLQNLDKWKLRDEETALEKPNMLKMDDSDKEGRNHAKPEGNKKENERLKMEPEASRLTKKIEQKIKPNETLTIKTLETKLIITEKKKDVKLA